MKMVEKLPVSKAKIGRINLNGVHLEPHEYETILFLNLYGYDIEVLRPNNTPKVDNPDFCIDGAIWEAKSPEGSGNSTIARHVHKAGRQADRLVLDLRRIKIPEDKAKQEAIRRFKASARIKRMLLITKNAKLLDIIK